ncbi:MAG: hypothetical protein ACTJHQ_08700, partial [Lacticaseibacillus paracasei]
DHCDKGPYTLVAATVSLLKHQHHQQQTYRIALRTPVFSSKSTQLANTIIVHLNFISRVNGPKLSRKPHFPKHGT